jgi:hypothetical protein
MVQLQRCFPGTETSELESIRKKFFQYKELEEQKKKILLDYKKFKKRNVINSVQDLGKNKE